MSPSKTIRNKGRINYLRTKFHFEPAEKSVIEDLASQLQRIEDNIKTTVIFPYATELPPTFDSANPPYPLVPNSRAARLVHKFYNLTTPRNCTVNLPDNHPRPRTRCRTVSHGFRDIISHNRVQHGRVCHYFCLADGCIAGFDKIGNAKRHMKAKHGIEDVETEENDEDEEKHNTEVLVAAAPNKRELRKVTRGKISKQKSRSPTNGRKKEQNTIPLTPKFSPTLHTVLGLSFQMTINFTSREVTVTVTPTDSGSDSGELDSEKPPTGKFTWNTNSAEREELVALTGLLVLKYEPSKLSYQFNI